MAAPPYFTPRCCADHGAQVSIGCSTCNRITIVNLRQPAWAKYCDTEITTLWARGQLHCGKCRASPSSLSICWYPGGNGIAQTLLKIEAPRTNARPGHA